MNKYNRFRKWFDNFPERLVLFVLGLIYSRSLEMFILSSFMTFLTDVWNLKLKRASIIINVHDGLKRILEIFVGFFIDSYLGDRWMLILSCIFNFVGLVLLSRSVPEFFFKCEKTCIVQEDICYAKLKASPFYIGLALIIIGQAAQEIPLYTLSYEQLKLKPMPKDKSKIKKKRIGCIKFKIVKGERRNTKKLIRHLCKIFMFAGVITAIYGGFKSSRAYWTQSFMTSAITVVLGLLLFLCGFPFYPGRQLQQWPLSAMLRVIVSSMWKRHLNYQENPDIFHRGEEDEQNQTPTDRLRWLNKAAIIQSPTDDPNVEVRSRRLICTVKEVEQTKTLLGITPVAVTFIVYGMVKSVGSTFFIEQANMMDRNVHFGPITRIPIGSLQCVQEIASALVKGLYTMTLEKRITGTNKRYSDGMKIGLGMLASMICCTVASKVEAKRLQVLRENGLLNNPDAKAPMSVFWLVPQFIFLGAMDGLALDGIKNFFSHYVPRSMKRYAPIFTNVLIGCGIILSINFEAVLDKYNKLKGHASWIGNSINQSHLDYLYRALTVVTMLNLFLFTYIASRYSYENVVGVVEEEEEEEEIVVIKEEAAAADGKRQEVQPNEFELTKVKPRDI